MGINTEREKGFGVLTPKWDVFIKPLPSRVRELCTQGVRKTLRACGVLKENGPQKGEALFEGVALQRRCGLVGEKVSLWRL